MSSVELATIPIEVDGEGFMLDHTKWNRDIAMQIFEGNPDARWVSPHSEAGKAAAAKAALEDDASGSGSATPVEDPGTSSMSPVNNDDSEDDFAPAKPQANDDSSDDFAPAKKNGHDDDSEDDFKAAPQQQQQPGVAALLGDLDSDDSEDDGDYDDAGSDDIGDSWLLDVAEPFSSVFSSSHKRVGLAYDELMARHEDNASNHPERPERITMSYAELGRQGLLEKVQRIPPRRASTSPRSGWPLLPVLPVSLPPVQQFLHRRALLNSTTCPALHRWRALLLNQARC